MSDPTELLKVTDYSTTSVRTMKNSAGQIGFAPHNLILASEDFSDSNWTKTDTTVTSNAATAPDGTITADKISHTSTSAGVEQYVTAVSGTKYVMGVFLKYVDHQWIRLIHDAASSWFDLQNGVMGTDNSEGAIVVALANDWYYVTLPDTQGDTTFTWGFTLASADGSPTETSGTEAYIWGAHLYENGLLAGMFDVPEDQRAHASLTKYLPNTSTTAARFLPRRDNHEYIDGAWVKGLKVESEARTNLVPDSLDLTAGSWTTVSSPVVTDNGDGSFTIEDDNAAAYEAIQATISITSGTTTYTQSVDVKKTSGGTSKTVGINFQLAGGTTVVNNVRLNTDTGTLTNATTAIIKDVGDYWRVSTSVTDNASGNTSCNLYLYPATDDYGGSTDDATVVGSATFRYPQVEAGSTPSSLIPTYGATRTRTAETFTQKADKIIWPNTTYVDGTELWADSPTTGTGWTDNGDGTYTKTAGTGSGLGEAETLSSRDVLEVTYTVSGRTAGTVEYRLASDVALATNTVEATNTNADGTYTQKITADANSAYHGFYADSSFDGTVSIVSVKEINPRALAVVMHGYMTYADEGTDGQSTFMRQYADSSNYLSIDLDTASTATGEVNFNQNSVGTLDTTASSTTAYAAGVNQPFKIAGRFLDNALQGAADGTATTENTTPPGLPDLSSTQIEWFYDFMGHIEDVPVYVEDIEEGGLTALTAKGFPQ